MAPILKILVNVKKKLKDLLDANYAQILQSQFVELMEETTKILVCAPAEEIARNIVKENAHKKKVVLGVPVF